MPPWDAPSPAPAWPRQPCGLCAVPPHTHSKSTAATPTLRSAGTTPCAPTWRRVSKAATTRSATRRCPMRATYSFDNGDLVAKRLDLLQRVRRRLQEALRRPRERHRLVRRRLRRYQPAPTRTRRWSTSRATSTTSTAARPSACTPAPPARCSTPSCSAASTSATCRSTPSSAATPLYWGESLFLGGNLHSIAYCAEPARPAEGLRHAGRRGQGTVPSAQPALGAGAGDRHAVGGGAVHARVGVLPLSRRRHLPRPGGLRVQRPGSPVPLAQASASRSAATASEPGQTGEWGLSTRWSPQWLDGTVGALLPQLRRQAAADAADAGRRRAPASTT